MSGIVEAFAAARRAMTERGETFSAAEWRRDEDGDAPRVLELSWGVVLVTRVRRCKRRKVVEVTLA